MLNTGPDPRYGYQVEGEAIRLASKAKTIKDAVQATRHGKTIVSWHVPGLTPSSKKRQMEGLMSEFESALRQAL
jgi:hypothetical protein